ncbi:MAG: hypothetical protein OWT28_06595 [Firmicutes bacterium]|nr:hypothetical protein [Bacillota bacterium]
MRSIATQLLSEKLVDDFYEQSGETRGHEGRDLSLSAQELTEQLKSLLPVDQHELLFRWEAHCNEIGSLELRRFADFMAEMLMSLPSQVSIEGGRT